MASIQGKLEKSNISARRKLFDNNVRLVGIEAELLRFKIVEDRYGDETVQNISQDSIVARISYPGEIPLSRFRMDAVAGIPDSIPDEVDETHTFFFEILPIELFVQWSDNVEKGDMLLHRVNDEHDNPIKIMLKVSELLGTFQTELLWRKAYCAPFNGIIPAEVQTIINEL